MKAITDCRSLSAVEVYADGKDYVEWLEKLVNATDQARPGMGNLLRNMASYASVCLGTDFGLKEFQDGQYPGSRATLQATKFDAEGGTVVDLGEEIGWPALDWNQVKADLYHVLVSRLSGEYLTMVMKHRGNGVTGFQEVHRWCTLQNHEGLMARLGKLQNPEKAQNEGEIYTRVEAWTRELRELVKIDPKLDMGDMYKMLHVRKILIGKTKEVIDAKIEWTWDDFLKTVKEWGMKKRVESRDQNQMQVGSVGSEQTGILKKGKQVKFYAGSVNQEEEDPAGEGGDSQPMTPTSDEYQGWEGYGGGWNEEESIDWVDKGKGKRERKRWA